MATIFGKVIAILQGRSRRRSDKASAELGFWKQEISKYVEWYQGKRHLYGFLPPMQVDKYAEYGLPIDALIAWLRLYQQPKYLVDLQLRAEQFRGMRMLDVGCGPFPSIFAFKDAEYYGIDPLIDEYRTLGYPIDLWTQQGLHYYTNYAERMPFEDDFFDVVVSVNAIDHVDDFAQTAREIKRVMKPKGILHMHVHYHKRMISEPIELDDQVFLQHYDWVPNLKKIYQSRTKDMGLYTAPEGEVFVLWGNS